MLMFSYYILPPFFVFVCGHHNCATKFPFCVLACRTYKGHIILVSHFSHFGEGFSINHCSLLRVKAKCQTLHSF